ncbi:protein Shroom2 isoform X5 [Colossoma macropomum]|uniref:protein Shroom2 isoform X5 n=2 Tax=Colossoma macropomum TaxID=42526 RepID=UPI001863B44D|nr:protein Shroom2 isoform X5 [Colossoma macropomum]
MYEVDTMGDHSLDSRFTDRDDRLIYESSRTLDQNGGGGESGEGWRLVGVSLCGGAPWGFTLRGGREHGEPLIITKVEEGSKAAAVRLQAGDELININDISLSGYRQEAICLVKGSHKTLTLVVKRRMKMVDIVAQKMASESDVHVARSFLTKILRSSMRKNRFKGRNESMSRPHSWHSTKFNESQSETGKTQPTPSPVWQTRYDASSLSSDLTTGWDQTNLRRVSDQFSSLGSMDSLEHGSHPYPPGRLSPSKSNANSIEHLGGGKRDSAYSSFSTSSGTPDYTLSKSNAASTENMLYKISQWDSGSRPSNGRHSQNLNEGVQQDDRIGYLQLPSGTNDRESPKTVEQPGYRHSGSGKASSGPVWHIPDMKKTMAPSPPPPTPPTRRDSFAATKVHEKGLVPSYPEGPGVHVQSKIHVKGVDRVSEVSDCTQRIYQASESALESCQNYNPPTKGETVNSYIAAESYNQEAHHLNSNKTYSLSTTDVRAGHSSYAHLPYHQRQYSDESTFHAPSRMSSKPQNISSCYSSMQELPTNSHTLHYSQNQVRKPVASLSSTTIDQNTDIHSTSRYYCVTSRQHPPGLSQASLVRVEDWKANSVIDVSHSGDDRSSQGLQKDRYTPQVPLHLSNTKDSNGYYRQVDSQHRTYTAVNTPLLDDAPVKASEVRGSQKQSVVTNSDTHFISYPPNEESEQGRIAAPLQLRESSQEHLLSKSGAHVCPQNTPLLHSLSQESSRLNENKEEMESENSQQESVDPQTSKQVRRSDRFATTLRNEIQMRRAQLQKSRSAAALSGSLETEEEPSFWKSTENSASSSDGSFTSTYKDHLKEAQARVLKATSFRRRDLEPVLLEHPGSEDLPSVWKDTPSMPSVSEVPLSKATSGGNQVTRICGRKRFPVEKKVRSLSEPDKINEMGVDEEPAPLDNTVSLVGRRKFFEAKGKPAYQKPLPKQNQQISDDPRLAKPEGKPQPAQSDTTTGDSNAKATAAENSPKEGQDGPTALHRLGTFAEYEATWKTQRKVVEPRTSGRYHSADNILDQAVEQRSKPACFHERSRSSPSDDFYGQNIQIQGRKSAEYPSSERKLSDHDNSSPRLNERGYSDLVSKNLEPPPSLSIRGDLEKNLCSDPLPAHHKSLPNSACPSLYFPDHSILPETSSFTKSKGSISPRPPLPRLDKYKYPETTPPLSSSQGKATTSHSPVRDTTSAPVPTQIFWKDPDYSKGPKSEEEQQSDITPPVPPTPAAPPVHQASGLTQPTMEGQRSPSPQFAPQRLTDKPPVSVSLQDEASGRMDRVTDDNTTVKKVPIKIVHSESNTEKESRQYLHPSSETPPSPQGSTVSSLSCLATPKQSSSPFCTYTRQKDQEAEVRDTMGNQKEQEPYADVTGPLEQHGQLKDSSVNQSSNGVSSVNLGSSSSHAEEDEKREVLARDIIDKDKSLADILDQSKMRTTMDLMEGIFPQEEQLMEEAHQRRRVAPNQASSRNSEDRREEDSMAAVAALVTSSAYYSTSAPKAELLIKMKDMQEQSVELDSEEELEEDNDSDLANKKHELIDSLSKKLQVLREARESLQEDMQDNNALGEEVEATVQAVCKPNELEKFRMFVGDLDKVVSLLLSLSGRLARVENALNSLEEDASLEERCTLTEKRKLLIRQHEDAKELKENLDRRERVVYDILASCLQEESLADYKHFVKMKSALIIEQRKLEDKIKLGEEQLKCLLDSLPPDQRMPT